MTGPHCSEADAELLPLARRGVWGRRGRRGGGGCGPRGREGRCAASPHTGTGREPCSGAGSSGFSRRHTPGGFVAGVFRGRRLHVASVERGRP